MRGIKEPCGRVVHLTTHLAGHTAHSRLPIDYFDGEAIALYRIPSSVGKLARKQALGSRWSQSSLWLDLWTAPEPGNSLAGGLPYQTSHGIFVGDTDKKEASRFGRTRGNGQGAGWAPRREYCTTKARPVQLGEPLTFGTVQDKRARMGRRLSSTSATGKETARRGQIPLVECGSPADAVLPLSTWQTQRSQAARTRGGNDDGKPDVRAGDASGSQKADR